MKMQKIDKPTMKIAGDPATNSRQSSLKLELKPNGPFRYGARSVFPLGLERVSAALTKSGTMITSRSPLLIYGTPKFGMTSSILQTGIA